MLDSLAELHTPCCILSNKSDEFTAPLCQSLLSRWNFVQIQGMVDESRRKPDPRTALELARAMRRRPSEVFFVGDSDTDIETARNAGMVPVGVTWGYRDRPVLEAARPEFILAGPDGLVSMIQAGIH
jgi:phosphoglycolate phosphatase